MDYLAFLDQLVDNSQTRAVGEIIRYALQRYVDGKRTLSEVVEKVISDINREGLDIISPFGKDSTLGI